MPVRMLRMRRGRLPGAGRTIKKRTAEILMRNFAVLFLFFVCRLELLYDITREQATRNDIVTAEGYAYSLEN